MINYDYTARDSTGKKVTSSVQASNERAAARLIKEQGLTLVDLQSNTSGGGGLFSSFRNRIKTKEKIIFARQLSTLINAGLPLVQSLRSVADQTDSKPMKLVINDIIVRVEAGGKFSEALMAYPKVFGQVFVSLVASGEVSGTLDNSLERLAHQQEKDAEVNSKVRGALVYPAVVLLVMIGVVTFMLVGVLPQVEELYDGLPGARLPFVTRLLLAISGFVTSFWWLVVIILFVAGVLGRRWVQTIGGRRAFDRLKMRAPPFGQLFMKLYMARFSRTGSTLVASGVPLIQVLEIVSKAVNNVIIADSINGAIEKVKGGRALSDSIEGDSSFLSLVPNMLRIGEQSGSIEQMMERSAIYYEKEVDNQIKTISTIIEPILMVILGIVAITIVAAILLPIYSLVGENVLR